MKVVKQKCQFSQKWKKMEISTLNIKKISFK